MPFAFNSGCIKTFKKLKKKNRLVSSPIFYYYNLDFKLILEINAFDKVVAEILSQLHLDNK